MVRPLICMVMGVAIAACATEPSPPEKIRGDIPEPGSRTVEMVGPVFQVRPGERRFICMRMPFRVEEDMYVNRTRVYQTAEGHHSLVLHRDGGHGVDPNPHPCGPGDMTDVRFVTSGAANGAGLEMPPGVALEIPRGVEIWVQTHYTNSTGQPRPAQDVIQMEIIPSSEVREVASVFAQVDVGFRIPPGGESKTTMACEFRREMTIPWILPHMHEYGTHFDVELFRGDGGEPLYSWSGTWLDEARHTFPILQLPVPVTVRPGDGIRTTCTWRNSGEEPLGWPTEMCVSLFPFYPGDGSLVTCDQNGTVSDSQAPE